MTPDFVLSQLEFINNHYSNIILSSNYSIDYQTVSWRSYTGGIYNRILYAREYEELLNNRQYSFLLADKSFFQFFFDFDEAGLKKAKLCYYPFPLNNSESDKDLENYFEQSGSDILDVYYYGFLELMEQGIKSTNSSHLRLDYDRQVDAHSPSHMQYSGVNSIRIPMNCVISPFLFFDFIISNTMMKDGVEHYRNSAAFKYHFTTANRTLIRLNDEFGIHMQYMPT